MRLTNLIELTKGKEYEEKLRREYEEDQSWGKAHKRYYLFLTDDFYEFLINIDKRIKNGELEIPNGHDLYGLKLKVPANTLYGEFIMDSINRSGLGIARYIKEDSIVIITINRISLHDLSIKFYEELQRIERTMKSTERIQEELNQFKNENKEWLEKKKERNKAIENVSNIKEDEQIDRYYNYLLEDLYKFIESYYQKDNLDPKTKIKSPLYGTPISYGIKEYISNFLTFYNLGYYKDAIFYFEGTFDDLKTAYWSEMQRLEYLSPKKTLRP